MMMASPHFSVSEFTFSETASRHGIDNSCPDDNILDNILITANYMESVRELLNHKPIFINSGYRNLELNELLGSKATSSHVKGLAADFTCRQFGTPNEIVFAIINSDIDYDQLILEYDQWVHISFCEDEKIPRRQALVINKDGTMIYTD